MACMKLGSKSEVFHLDGQTWSVSFIASIFLFLLVRIVVILKIVKTGLFLFLVFVVNL